MLILAINTASSITGIALFELKNSSESVPGNVLTIAGKSWPAKNNEAEKLMPEIDKLLNSNTKKFEKKYSEIKQIYVIKGPGSFTGLRVGVTVANTISYLTKAEIFAPSTFEYWHSQTDLPILIFAGSGGVFFSKNSKSQPQLINLPELNKFLNSRKIKEVAGDISPEQIKILKKIKFRKLKTNFASAMQSLIGKNLKNNFFKVTKIVKPLYIKEPSISIPKSKITYS